MKILVINCGSSSLKFQVMDMENESVIGKGLVERIGIDGSNLVLKVEGRDDYKIEEPMKDHKEAIKHVFDALTDKDHGVLESLEEINGIGHRVVHGGDKIADPVIVDDSVKEAINEFTKFAPLHNPGNLQGIEACEEVLPGVTNVAIFDTAFHQTMPAETYMYAIPYELYEKHGLRKYGFHGTSHRFITHRLAEILDKDVNELNYINCHLGNGASLCAIKNGKSYDTTMGLTPLEGLIMGTRSGDIDPTVVEFLVKEEGMTAEEVNKIFNKESGVLGISGISSDFRDLEEAAENDGNERAKLALDAYVVRVKKYLGAYLAELDKVDAIVFTAGIGENSGYMRDRICSGLEHLGIKIDAERNDTREEALVSSDDSKILVYSIPTDEELMIARDTKDLVSK